MIKEPRPRRLYDAPLMAAALLLSPTLSSCGGAEEAQQYPVVFDDLGGGDPEIFVYPGVTESDEDRIDAGKYRDGLQADAECKTEGRRVDSHPEVGELPRSSKLWARLVDGRYATFTYLEHPEALAEQLPDC